ncbi:hypothetical protein [Micromonospora humi]|uniref:Uncharacterized protein n=1 Tax=Micromonospora humi TaxID=745366 RepID=A0A1C5IRM9_9ACTN|nr:hypothetical protein [Micromonospora humi]SCG60436.1 hypothetical protein GA0070213_106342 [Micromonospora humi]
MAFPRTYPPEFIDAAVRRVADTRSVKAYGAVTTVARQLDLDPRRVQKWVTRATTPTQPQNRDLTNGREARLAPGLLHCGRCRQPMNRTTPPGAPGTYRCPPGCRRQPLDSAAITDTVGRVILRHAARILPTTSAPLPPCLAAAHAHRVLARVTVGATASDIALTWRPALPPERTDKNPARRVTGARDIARRQPVRARQLLHQILTGVDPATAPAHPLHADAAALLAELHLRHGRAADATIWAAYAHRSAVQLHGHSHPDSLRALHLHAAVQRHAGHHQRAYHLYRQLGGHLSNSDGPHSPRTLAIHATTALVLHDLGHCHAAHILLTDTIATHRQQHPGHPAATRMTRQLTRIHGDCVARGHQHDT